MNANSKSEVSTLVKARYPFIYIVSAEESRVLTSLTEVAKVQGLSIMSWSITKGFASLIATSGAPAKTDVTDPKLALAWLEKTTTEGVFVLRDFHPFLNDPVCVRSLRDTIEAFRTGKARRTLLILSPVQNVPAEVEKSVAIVDWSLPTREDLRVMAAPLAKQIKGSVDMEAVIDAALGLTEVEAENALSKAAVKTKGLDPRTIQEEKRQIIRKSGLLEYVETEESEGTVGGLGNVKGWLRKRRNAFSEKARAFKLPRPKGLVVVGIPGTGKSLLAKATGTAWGMPLLKLDMGKIFQGLVGSSEENMRKVLRTVEAVAPCVLWIDEIEKGFSGTGSSGQTDGGTTSRVFGTFLTWMQEKKADVFVVATANAVESLPPELLRKGRFDEIFFVDLPTHKERDAIFRIHLGKVGRSAEAERFDLTLLSDMTEGYTGAEIEQIVGAALYDAFDEGTELAPGHLVTAARKVVPISRTAEKRIADLRAWASDKAVPASEPEQANPTGRVLNLN